MISKVSSAVSSTDGAAMLSSNWSTRFAPTMTLVTTSWCSSHASAI